MPPPPPRAGSSCNNAPSNRQEPRPKRRLSQKPWKPGPGEYKCILRSFFRLLWVPQYGQRGAIHDSLMPDDKVIEGPRIPLLGTQD